MLRARSTRTLAAILHCPHGKVSRRWGNGPPAVVNFVQTSLHCLAHGRGWLETPSHKATEPMGAGHENSGRLSKVCVSLRVPGTNGLHTSATRNAAEYRPYLAATS